MECNFCNSILKTLSSFNYHQKYNKKCLDIQNTNSKNFKTSLVICTFCNKQFADINKHSCKIQKIKEIENIKSENLKLKNENKKLIEEIKKLQF